ncbi:MAG: hypothetical protein QXE66_04600 [Desulfurococcaceae archaeon]
MKVVVLGAIIDSLEEVNVLKVLKKPEERRWQELNYSRKLRGRGRRHLGGPEPLLVSDAPLTSNLGMENQMKVCLKCGGTFSSVVSFLTL